MSAAIDLTKAPASPRAVWELEIKMQRDHLAAISRSLRVEMDRSRRLIAESRALVEHIK